MEGGREGRREGGREGRREGGRARTAGLPRRRAPFPSNTPTRRLREGSFSPTSTVNFLGREGGRERGREGGRGGTYLARGRRLL